MPDVEKIVELRAANWSIRQIAAQLDLPAAEVWKIWRDLVEKTIKAEAT